MTAKQSECPHIWTPASSKNIQRVGLYTGGGLAPGLNAVIAGATTALTEKGHNVVGLRFGNDGLLTTDQTPINLSAYSRKEIQELMHHPGTILGSSRTKVSEADIEQVRTVLQHLNISSLIAIGGDDTLGYAKLLHEKGIPANGVPKTIDNDVRIMQPDGTEMPHTTFGFETAYNRAREEIIGMHTEARDNRSVSIVQIMGRHAGWITLYAGKAGNADITLIPECPVPEEQLLAKIESIYDKQGYVVIAVSEGYKHEGKTVEDKTELDDKKRGRLGGIDKVIQGIIVNKLNMKRAAEGKRNIGTKTQIPGYNVRDCAPTAADSMHAYRLGTRAGALAAIEEYGYMSTRLEGQYSQVPLAWVHPGQNVPPDLYDMETMSMKDVPWTIQEMQEDIRRTLASAACHHCG